MLRLTEKEIDVNGSGVLFSEPFLQQTLQDHWELCSGQWSVQDGWLTGLERANAGGMIFTKAGFPGDVMIDFCARTVPPCTNDLNFVWNAAGWVASANDAGECIIGSLNGWWDGKLGLEHYPDCQFRCTTGLFLLEAGRTYHIQAGSIGGHSFIAVDGVVALEASDPCPVDTAVCNRVGLGVYCSHVQFRDLVVRQIKWNALQPVYNPNF